jgi:hypothetical protein
VVVVVAVERGCIMLPDWEELGAGLSLSEALLPERGLRLLNGRVRVNPPSSMISPAEGESQQSQQDKRITASGVDIPGN